MTLEDFEKSLIEGKESDKDEKLYSDEKKMKKRRKHHHRDEHHRRKRSRRSKDAERSDGELKLHAYQESRGLVDCGSPGGDEDEWVEKTANGSRTAVLVEESSILKQSDELRRDIWMEAPSNLDAESRQSNISRGAKPVPKESPTANFELKVHKNEPTKHHLQDVAEVRGSVENLAKDHGLDYIFGDAGAKWRMMKLRAVFRQAEESGMPVDVVAMERFGDLRTFDDAREEQIELERRETYGKGYIGKDRPSGELFRERKVDNGVRLESAQSSEVEDRHKREDSDVYDGAPSPERILLDQTALNRLKAQMLKAKMRDTPDAARLEQDYAKALKTFGNRQEADLVVLSAMENRMLTSGRNGEVIGISTKRGRERGLVEENEDMSIEDMVREERRTRNQAGGDGKRFADRIAKDVKFDVNPKYLFPRCADAKRASRMVSTTWMRTQIDSQSVSRNPRSTSRTLQYRIFKR